MPVSSTKIKPNLALSPLSDAIYEKNINISPHKEI